MADGRFLEPRVGIYRHNEVFCRMMGGASEMAAAELGNLLAHGPVTPAQVGQVMDTIAMVREAVAGQAGDTLSGFGIRIPPGTMPFDVVQPHPSHRHAPYFPRAQEWAAHAGADEQEAFRQRQVLTLETDGVRLTAPLSHPNQEGNLILIHHPGGQEAMPLRAHALHLFAEVLNTPDMSEQDAMRRLGRAHCLLMHGVPYARGSPSIVETLIDATLRARYGVTLPPKRENVEPFWEAIFTPGVLIDLYAARFRELYE
jgi:hypothetical protein